MSQPCVNILTPVFNGEDYLAECIDSVRAQSYGNWEYYICDNCSTDRTLEIARSYAKTDRRIRVRSNERFLSAIENHNAAFALMPSHCKYCKVVCADDWIMADCVEKMVRLAEAHPTVGIVGCYQQSAKIVKWKGLSPTVSVMPGRDVCRLGLLDGIHVFGTPTSVLYRSDLLGMRESFFPHARSHADCSACYEALQHCDFGFLHEVLAAERVHSGQWSSAMDSLDAGSVAYLEILLQYGPVFLSAREFDARKREVLDGYYRGLGGCILKLKGTEFWKFHRSRLSEMGCELAWDKIAKAAINEVVTEAKNPMTAMRKILAVISEKIAQ